MSFKENKKINAELEGIGKCNDCGQELVEGYYWSRPDRNLKFCADCGQSVLDEEEEDPDNLSNFESEKVKKIMWAVIDCSITKEQAMATLRIKYAWLYPYITPEVYKQHHDLYLSSNGYEEPDCDEWNPDRIKIKNDEMGLCNVCNSWQPICKFQEDDIIKQPCKDCYEEAKADGWDDEDIQKCYNCDEVLDEDMHIFCYRKGDDEMVHCQQCAEDCYEEAKADGWIRDDDNEY